MFRYASAIDFSSSSAESVTAIWSFIIRSHLWQDTYKIERAALPSYGQMLKDQIAVTYSAEELEKSIAEAYRNKLY